MEGKGKGKRKGRKTERVNTYGARLLEGEREKNDFD
jgi:hypothetical protein